MADITDIKAILYTDKTLKMQSNNIITIQTSTRVTKYSLKQIFKEHFNISTLRINSMNVNGKIKKFKGIKGKKIDTKKFYVKIPSGAKIPGLAV